MKPKLLPSYWQNVFEIVSEEVKGPLPSVSEIDRIDSSPFRVLISTIISLRTKDVVTFAASKRLLDRANSAQAMALLRAEEIATLIYPAGFYHTKADSMLKICQILLEKYDGEVPSNKEELMALPGVGLKTANLVLSVGFNIPAICVDIHVHRIANRMGWLKTKNPDKTEGELQKILPQEYWIPINELLVLFGQQVCKPVSPFCSVCKVLKFCERVGVEKSR